MDRFSNPKFIAALAVAGLAVIVFLQNRATIVLNVLFLAKVETTVATALCAAFLIGLATGALVFSHWSKRSKAKTSSET